METQNRLVLGDRAALPCEGTFPRPSRVEVDCDARSFPGDTLPCGRGGRGAVARPRKVRWRSGEPVPRGEY